MSRHVTTICPSCRGRSGDKDTCTVCMGSGEISTREVIKQALPEVENAQARCGNCAYADPLHVGATLGLCRRNPPTVHPSPEDGEVMGRWPEVRLEVDWCGDYEPVH